MTIFNAHAERNRRIAQIERYLLLMSERFHKDPGDDKFIVFNEDPPREMPWQKADRAAKRISIPAVAASSGVGFAEGLPDSTDAEWRGDGAPKRFLQYCFSPDWFFIELPSTTLEPAEAERIERERPGFRYCGRGLPWRWSAETVKAFNPFAKIYLYGDERIAAEDAAYVLFDVWKFPLDWTFFVKASEFLGPKRYEQGDPMG